MTTKGYRFGIERLSRRYSTPNNLKGNKLSCESMNKTMKLKLHKVDDIRTARSEMEMYSLKKEIEEVQSTEKQFFKTHSRILRGGKVSQQRLKPLDSNELHVKPKPKEQKVFQKPKTFYYSNNLEQKMNLYMNNLIYKSQEEHKQKLKQLQQKKQDDDAIRKTSYNTRTLFWKRMKKFVSQKQKSQKSREKERARSNQSFTSTFLTTKLNTFRVSS